MGKTESAEGAILTIPEGALNDIKKADDAIKKLGKTSDETAKAVAKHWSEIAVGVFDAFIRKVEEAKGKVGTLGTVSIDTRSAESELAHLAASTHESAVRVREELRSLGDLGIDFSRLKEEAERLKLTYAEIDAEIRKLKSDRQSMGTESPEAQSATNAIRKWEEYLALRKKSTEETDKAKQKEIDNAGLQAQKALTTEILQLKKAITQESIKQEKETLLGKTVSAEDIDKLRRLQAQLSSLQTAYENLKTAATTDLSTKAQTKFNQTESKHQIDLINEETNATQKLAQARQRAAELTNSSKLKSGGIGSSAEAIYQRQLVSAYQEQIKIIKQKGQIEAKAATEGRSLTAEEANQIRLLADAYVALNATITSVEGTYTRIDAAAQQAFNNAKARQEAENAALMEEARRKAAARASSATTTTRDDVATAAQYNRLYKEQATIIQQIMELNRKGSTLTIEELNRLTALKQQYSEIENQIESLNRKRQSASTNLARIEGEMRREAFVDKSSASGAISYAKQAKSLKELQDAYKNLKQVMNTVDPKSAEWRQMNIVYLQTKQRIDEIRKSMGELNNQSNSTRGVMSQLKNAMAGMFSVAAIGGYIKKMVEVRAQFELQNVALRAILQNKDEADKIFMQVQQMALQSPFTIMQLTTYTKQLAAYRVEADKLVGTTKMLADVSAGLGVDMQRLILAYGQVKSANYLRACLGFDTPVKMFDGTFKKVQDIAVGDVLMGDDEQPRHVSTLYQGEQMMYRVCYNGGEFRCNEHHILTVYDASTERIEDVFVLDYLKEPHRYQGVKRINGEYKTFPMKVEKDIVDTYYGFSIDGNRRFIIQDNIVTHNTEVRQFTEAGLNIAGELAQYFSELQGKMISVGDVMEMITKRMVRFEDVEEVFKRVTSAGGLFYDMQRKQSESLYGQMQRISDAYSIMMNEIGKSNQGGISSALSAIRSLINSWRTIASILKVVIGLGGSFWLILKAIQSTSKTNTIAKWLTDIWTNLNKSIIAAGGLKKALLSLNATSFFGIAGAIGLLVYTIYDWVNATDALNEELTRVTNEGMSDMYDLMLGFKKLADDATDINKPIQERTKALEDLNRTYKDILPSEMLEIENLQKMGKGYEEAISLIRMYSLEKTKAKATETVEQEIEKDWSTLINRVKDSAGILIDEIEGLKDMPEASLRGVMANIMMQIRSEIENGTIEAQDAWKRFKEIFKDRLDVDLKDDAATRVLRSRFGQFTFVVTDYQDDLLDIVEKSGNAMVELNATFEEALTKQERIEKNSAQPFVDSYEKRKQAILDLSTALQDLQEQRAKGDISFINGEQAPQLLSEAWTKFYMAFNAEGEDIKISMQDIWDATENGVSVMEFIDNAQKQFLGGFLTNLQNTDQYLNNNWLKSWSQRTQTELRNAGLSDMQLDIINLGKTEAEHFGLEIGLLDKLRIAADTNYSSAAKSAKALSDEAAENIKKIVTTRDELIRLGLTASEAQKEAEAKYGGGLTEEQLNKEQDFWDKLSKLYGLGDKDKKTKGRDPWQERVSLIKEMNTEYEKLLKYYNEGEAKLRIQSSYAEAVADAFKGITVNGKNLGDIKLWQGFDKKGMIDQLQNILNAGLKISKEKRVELKKLLGGLQAEVDIKIQEDAKDKLQKEIDTIFDNYELTKELGSLGMNVDITYMFGGKPMTLAQARKALQDTYAQMAKDNKLGDDALKAYQTAMKKLDDLEQKAAIQRIKNYNKYMLESMSERIQIQMKTAQEIRKISASEELDDTTKQMAILREREEERKKLAQQEWKDFQGSDMYVSLFEDMEHASTVALKSMLEKLQSLRASLKDLPPDQLRAVMKQIQSIEEQIYSRNPFAALTKNIGTAIDAFRNLGKKEEEFRQKSEELETARRTRDDFAAYTSELEEQLRIEEAKLGKDEYGLQIENEMTRKLKEIIALRRKELGLMNDNVETLEGETNEISNTISKLKQGKKAAGEALQTMGGWSQELGNTIGAVASSLENVFGTMSDGTRDTIESIQEILGGTGDMLSGVGRIMAGDIFGGVMQAISGLASTIGAIFAIGDKKKERQIKRLQEKVEELDKAYQKLQKSIENAYKLNDYNLGYNRAMKNLQQQKAAYQEMIRLEQAKKKTDKDKIKEYQDALDEISETMADLRKQRIEDMGSTQDYWNEADGYVSAWLSAYREVGQGIDSLNESWDEFVENLVIRQASAAIVTKRMESIIGTINSAIDSGKTGLALSETVKQAGALWKEQSALMNKELKEFFDAFGVSFSNGKNVLSDLQKGIQNITEPQAAAIEAYLNSIRFYVAGQYEIITDMLNVLRVQYGNANNPVLQEVKAIRSLVDSINTQLSRVIVTRNSAANSQYLLKVG